MPAVTYDPLELIDRTRRRLQDLGVPCGAPGPASEDAIAAAEEALGASFPPSYRSFLRGHGALILPPRLSTIHQFVGIAPADDGQGVIERTLHARVENRLGNSLVIVALGADAGEWFCVDTARARADGECPVLLFDARDNQLDQQFYDDFGQMVHEVLTFVLETAEEVTEASDPGHEVSQARKFGGSMSYEG
jgi:antitoxin YobK